MAVNKECQRETKSCASAKPSAQPKCMLNFSQIDFDYTLFKRDGTKEKGAPRTAPPVRVEIASIQEFLGDRVHC
jgi:hypothetical protein